MAEIGVGGLGQALAFERNHALIALHLRAAVDGHGEMALAEQLRGLTVAAGNRRDAVGGEARIAAQLTWNLVVGDEQIDRTVGRGLQDELALEF